MRRARFPRFTALILPALAGCLGLCSCSRGHPGGSPSGESRSVILISIDTLRRDHVGLYGYERDTTPNLDRLAAESLVFERAYTTMSWTLIAHMSLFTGLYPAQHRVWEEDVALPSSIPTLAERLGSRGYFTAGLYQPGWLDPRFGFDRGFDVYRPHDNAREATAHLEQVMASRPEDRPFFLFLHLFDVHCVPLRRDETGPLYNPPAPYGSWFLEGAKKRVRDLPRRHVYYDSRHEVTEEQHEAIVALYDGGIRFVDEVVGGWIDDWRKEKLLDEVLLIVTSDHGEGLAQRVRKYGGHGEMYEEGLRVPLLIRFPDERRAGERIEQAVSRVDVLPTLLDWNDIGVDIPLAGHTLLKERPEGSLIYAQRPRGEVCIRWPHKVVRMGRGSHSALWIHDLREDPGESTRIAVGEGSEGDRLLRLVRDDARQERAGWYLPQEPNPVLPPDAKQADQLRALGYMGGE